jgi:hypothetical protein
MARNLLNGLKKTAVYGVTTTTAQTVYSDQVDMANYEGCVFTAVFKSTGASTGTAALSIIGTDTSTAASTDYTALNGASITVRKSTTASAKRVGALDIYRPQYRYLKAKVVQLAKIAVCSIVADHYGARYEPVTQSTAVSAAAHAAATLAASFKTVIEAT